MINPPETQRSCRGKQNTETVYYVELEGRFRERGQERKTETEGDGEARVLISNLPKNPVETNSE